MPGVLRSLLPFGGQVLWTNEGRPFSDLPCSVSKQRLFKERKELCDLSVLRNRSFRDSKINSTFFLRPGPGANRKRIVSQSIDFETSKPTNSPGGPRSNIPAIDLMKSDSPLRAKLVDSALYKRTAAQEPQASGLIKSTTADMMFVDDIPAMEPAWMPVLKQVGLITIATFLFGYHLGVVNGPLDYIAVDLGIAEDAMLKGLVVSTCLAGAFAGSALSGTLADSLGRRRTLQLDALPLIVGPAISASASSVQMMLIGRLLTGLGMGVAGSLVPMYISEVSPSSQRGTMGGLIQISCCVGLLLVLVAGLPLSSVPGWWRTMFWLSTIPAAVLAMGMEIAADSPSWLSKKNRKAEAAEAIEKLWGWQLVKSTMDEYDTAAASGGQEDCGWSDLFNRRVRKVVIIGTSLFVLQQLSGINGILYFSSTVFKDAGISSTVAASAGVGLFNLLGSVGAVLCMDKLGRKKLLMGSFFGMGVAMVVLLLAMTVPALQPFSSVLSVVGTLMFVLLFACGVGPVPGLLLSEILPNRVRAKGTSLAMCVHWVFNFGIGLMFLKLLENVGAPAMYTSFGAACFLGALVSYLYVVETKGKSLEEIERLLSPPDR